MLRANIGISDPTSLVCVIYLSPFSSVIDFNNSWGFKVSSQVPEGTSERQRVRESFSFEAMDSKPAPELGLYQQAPRGGEYGLFHNHSSGFLLFVHHCLTRSSCRRFPATIIFVIITRIPVKYVQLFSVTLQCTFTAHSECCSDDHLF